MITGRYKRLERAGAYICGFFEGRFGVHDVAVWGGGATPEQALYMVGLILPPKAVAWAKQNSGKAGDHPPIDTFFFVGGDGTEPLTAIAYRVGNDVVLTVGVTIIGKRRNTRKMSAR
jgi:hypothetical protein